MPSQFWGSKEVVYQVYVCAFFTAAAQAVPVKLRWEVEYYSGFSHLDLMIQWPTDKYGAIQEYK
jgi:hypothetical protein